MDDVKRKLATIRRISSISSIEGANNIEVVKIDGWNVVVNKGIHKENDLVVFFEVDSFLPVRPEFEFLRKACFKSTKHLGDGFRLKTIKLRGQVSQGLALPITTLSSFGDYYKGILPPNHFVGDNGVEVPYLEGADCTDYIGVKKWEVPLSPQLAGTAKGNFPSFIRKTDQERIQNCYGDLVKTHKDTVFEASLKLDGSSMTVYFNDGQFGVCSRNLDLKETEDNTFWKVARKLKLEEALRSYGRNIALQGELMGPGVQGNREQLPDHDFYLFDVWDIDGQCYIPTWKRPGVVLDLYEFGSVIKTVPNLGLSKPLTLSLDQLIDKSDIKSLNHPVAEGIVYRSMVDDVSFKAINQKFLLQEK